MKRVLIVGATSGIGLQLTQDYAAAGWQVLAAGRNTTTVRDIAGVSAISVDITDAQQVQQAFSTLPDYSLDLLLLNAGTCEYLDTNKFDGDAFAHVINTNLVALGYCLQQLLTKLMDGGQLALTGSAVVHLPFPRAEAYGASKAAVHYLAGSLRLDLAARGIAVSEIQPGFVATPLTARNQFDMPWLMTPAQASQRIRRGLQRRRATIAFPRRLIWSLKLLALLPLSWQQRLLQRM
ncbi:SDR family NAD(P)-dependent oxidoreductase [Shewanella sp. A3A]|nr:SDR family NAD(P)-dependent oxidoreductase [Shewanella ferrihydritica]